MLEYHRQLLADEERTLAYREAIAKTVKPGDVVVDIGTGSGILSFFAAEAGAKRVYAIEQGEMAGVAAFLVRHNDKGGVIHVLNAESTKIDLPEQADVLVTETMGALGLDENIIGYTLDARARMLRDGAAIVPRRIAVSFVPLELAHEYETQVAWWSKPRYGLDLAPLRVFASNSLAFVRLPDEAYAATPAVVLDVDLATVTAAEVTGSATFTASRDATIHGFGAWFTADLAQTISFDSRNTVHWTQVLLPLETPIDVAKGERIDLEVETGDGRWWTWRGRIGSTGFHQTTWLSHPPFLASGAVSK